MLLTQVTELQSYTHFGQPATLEKQYTVFVENTPNIGKSR